jgi:hypothetical protein
VTTRRILAWSRDCQKRVGRRPATSVERCPTRPSEVRRLSSRRPRAYGRYFTSATSPSVPFSISNVARKPGMLPSAGPVPSNWHWSRVADASRWAGESAGGSPDPSASPAGRAPGGRRRDLRRRHRSLRQWRCRIVTSGPPRRPHRAAHDFVERVIDEFGFGAFMLRVRVPRRGWSPLRHGGDMLVLEDLLAALHVGAVGR